MRPIKIRLGEMLIKQGLITQPELDALLVKAKQTGRKLGRVLVDAKRIDEETLVKSLADQMGIPFVNVAEKALDFDLASKLPEMLARKYSALLLSETSGQGRQSFTVAMSDPADVFAYDEISKALGTDIEVVAATEDAIYSALDRAYKKEAAIGQLAEALSREFSTDTSDALDLTQLGAVAGDDAPVVRLIQTVFEDALSKRASDIHIEPMEKKVAVRIRVDGSLRMLTESDAKTAAPLAQRLKLMSGLNISEKRLPQDGRFNIKVHKNVIDVRIASSPTSYGESIVMRLLNQNSSHFNLDKLGMPPTTFAAFTEALEHPQGMILVTGPTGSGKTTSLYAALNKLNTIESKLITVEDPIEYRIPGINQIQTHEKIGLTFNAALRSILRQDPDVILVGEMRDKETVDAALRASMTGHLVLSTLHTNDSASAVGRLMDMGAEPFVIAQSLKLVLAQRLVRLNCTHCSQIYQPSDADLLLLETFGDKNIETTLKAPQGCPQCANTGFLGRAAVYEHLHMNRQLVKSLTMGIQKYTEDAQLTIGQNTLSHHAMKLAQRGVITISEAKRVSYES